MLSSRRARELQPRVTTAAAILARRTGMDPQEAEQEIWLGIMEIAHQRADFLGQKDCYMVQGGVFWARNEWRKRDGRTSREVSNGSNALAALGGTLDDYGLAERGYLRSLMRRLSGDRVAKALVAGIVRGSQKKEVARRAGVSPQAVSAAVRRVRLAMETMG